jgi:hypothetical protein
MRSPCRRPRWPYPSKHSTHAPANAVCPACWRLDPTGPSDHRCPQPFLQPVPPERTSTPQVEQAALLRTLAIAQGSFPTHWRAWRSAVSAARSAGRAAAAASGRGAAPGLGALWLLPAEADGAVLGPQEAAMVAHPGWAEPPSAKCTQYTAALEAAVRALSRGGFKGLR